MSEPFWPDGRPQWTDGYYGAKRLDSEEWLVLHPLTLGRARVSIMTKDNASVEHWCYDDPTLALVSWLAWPAAPISWSRHQRRDGSHEYPERNTG